MGLNFKELIVKQEISLKDLQGRILAVDSMNLLYQFLTTIRSPDGSVLTDAQGRVTSHLIGLFSRTTALMEQNIKLALVFDGKAPEIKRKTWEKRTAVKQEASLQLKQAQEAEDQGEMRKFASRTAVLTKDMISDAQQLLRALGLPIIQAPSEGEAQAAHIVKQGKAYACVSQDYDTLIFGAPLVVRNLSVEGKRKKAGKLAYETIKPECIYLKDILTHLNLTQDQLILLAILVGTDYNPGGVKGIGPKTGLKLVKEYAHDVDALFQKVEWEKHSPDVAWREIYDTIKQMPVTDDYTLEWKPLDEQKLIQLLVQEHGFSMERVNAKIEKLREAAKQQQQKGLQSFF